MSFKLSGSALDSLNMVYGKDIESLNETVWHIALNCCGCSGDCGSNWQRS